MSKLDNYRPQSRNANKHNPRGMGELEQSIASDGWIGAITVAADGETFDGSARLETLATAGLDEPIVVDVDGRRPVIVRRTDIATAEDERAKRLAIAANKIASDNLTWDAGVLAELAEEIDLSGLFREDELAEILADLDPEIVPGGGGDEFDPTPADGPTRAQLGDLWISGGRHRLLVGDCTDSANVERLMGGDRAALVVTSPPYWVGKAYEQERGRDEILVHIERSVAAIVGAVGDRPHIAINTGTTTETHQGGDVRRIYLLLDWWVECFAVHSIYLRNLRIWAKHGNFIPYSPGQDVVDLNWEFLASFTGAKPRAQNKIGERWALDGVWDCQPQTVDVGHDAAYPLEIPLRYMLLYTAKGDTVYEPYSGSGTTLVAGHRMGRKVYGCELLPKYADVILRRAEAEGLTVARVEG